MNEDNDIEEYAKQLLNNQDYDREKLAYLAAVWFILLLEVDDTLDDPADWWKNGTK